MCTGLVPTVCELDDDDNEVVRIAMDQVPAAHEKLVRKAVARSPMATLPLRIAE